jgi:hypothetical protein
MPVQAEIGQHFSGKIAGADVRRLMLLESMVFSQRNLSLVTSAATNGNSATVRIATLAMATSNLICRLTIMTNPAKMSAEAG